MQHADIYSEVRVPEYRNSDINSASPFLPLSNLSMEMASMFSKMKFTVLRLSLCKSGYGLAFFPTLQLNTVQLTTH